LTHPRNCGSLRLRNLVICTSVGDMLAQGGFDLLRIQLFPFVQTRQNGNFIAMAFESDKIMFEIYRETEYTGKYRVVYFTELQDHNKETEINHAMAGEHFFDGFIK